MPNFFDQFDAQPQGTNFFDQFDTPGSVVTPAQEPNAAAKDDREIGVAGTVSDVVQATGTGLRSGAEGLAGLPGDLERLIETVGGAGLDQLVKSGLIDQETRDRIGQVAGAAFPVGSPTSGDIREATTSVIGAPRVPQTTAGEFAKTIGEFAPAAIGGPGTLAGRAAVATTAAVASEAAGQLTEGTEVEPFARLAGGLIGGGAAAIRQFNAQARKALKGTTSRAQLKADTRKLYRELTDAQIGFHPQDIRREFLALGRALDKRALSDVSAPQATAYLKELGGQIDRLDFNRLEAFRKNIGADLRAMAKQAEPARPGDITALEMTRAAIDKIMSEARAFSATGSVISKDVGGTVKVAREMARRKIKSDQIEDAIEIAKSRRSDFQTAISNELSKLIRGNRAKQWTAAERQAIRLAAEGKAGRKAIKALSKFGFDLTNLGNSAALIPTAGFLASGGGLTLAGTGARLAGNRMAKGAADQASAVARAGIPGQQNLAAIASTPAQKRIQQLLLTEAVANSARPNQPTQ